MEIRWFQDLQSPVQPGIYRVNSTDLVMVRQDDINRSRKFNASEIRCSCVPNTVDAEGNPVHEIVRMAPWPVSGLSGSVNGY